MSIDMLTEQLEEVIELVCEMRQAQHDYAHKGMRPRKLQEVQALERLVDQKLREFRDRQGRLIP
jgi:hypothetical protein